MLPKKHFKVLKKLATGLDHDGVNWVVTGSTSFCLQGVPVSPNDIDIQTDESGAYEFEALFEGYVVKPVEFSATEKIKSHFGQFRIDGLQVEVMGAVQKFYDGKWEEPIDIDRYRKSVKFRGVEIPVLKLSYEAKAYRRFGRIETAKKLETYAKKERRRRGSQ